MSTPTVETFKFVSGKPTIDKDPGASLDYVMDWTDWLAVVTDTIVSATATGSGVVVDSCTVQPGGKAVLVWVSGGVANATGTVTIQISTASTPPRIDERTMVFKVKQR